jgi:hypothetical protein
MGESWKLVSVPLGHHSVMVFSVPLPVKITSRRRG